MEISEASGEKLIWQLMMAYSSFRESDLIGGDSASYEKFILDLDSYWDELKYRLSVSRMVSDSVVKGMVNAIAEEAAEKISLKEVEIATLKEKLQLSKSDAALFQNLELVEISNKPLVAEPEISDRLKSHERCFSASGDFKISDYLSSLRILANNRIQCPMKDLQHLKNSEIVSRKDNCPSNIVNEAKTSNKFLEIDQTINDLRNVLALGLDQISNMICSQEAVLPELQWEHDLEREITAILLQDYSSSLQDEYATRLYKQTVSIKTFDKDWQKKASELSALRDELRAISEELNNHDNFEEWSVAKLKEHFPSKLLGNRKFPFQHEENGTSMVENSGDSREHLLDIAGLLQLKNMIKESFKLKREFLMEMGSSTLRKDKEVEHLRKRLPDFILKLDQILLQNEISLPIYNHDDELQSSKERIDLLCSENRRLQSLVIKKKNEVNYLSAQITDASNQLHSSVEGNYSRQTKTLENDIEDAKAESNLSDALSNTILRVLVDDHKNTMQDTEIEIKFLMEIYTTILRDVICDAIYSMSTAISKHFEDKATLKALILEKEKTIMSLVEENQKLKQDAASLSVSVKEKEKLALESGSTLLQQKQQLDVVNQEVSMLRDRVSKLELQISEHDKESNSLRSRLNEAIQKIHHYELETVKLKEEHRVVSDVLKEAEAQKNMILGVLEDKQRTLSSSFEKDKERTKLLESVTLFMREMLEIFADLESRLKATACRNESRLKLLCHTLSSLLQLASQQKEKCLWYKNMLDIRCSDLQKAEAEVDLLADEVETLIGRLGKIYLAHDHYSPMSKRDNMKWTEIMDNIFIDAMLEQEAKRFRVDGTFTSTAYKKMLAVCVERFGIPLTKDHPKNRIKTLKSNFNTCHELFRHKSGISWSSTSKIFEAEDNVWDELIAANPHMKKWRNTPMHNYDKLEELFSKDHAIGNMPGTSKDFLNLWSKDMEEQAVGPLNEEAMGSMPTQDPSHEDVVVTSPTYPTSEYSMSAKSKKRKVDSPQETNSKLQDLISYIRESNELMYKHINPEFVEKEYTTKEIYEELSRLGVPRHSIVHAYVTLDKSKEYTRVFFSAPEDIRLEVLNELMSE